MANGKTLEEIREILKGEEKVPAAVVTRLSLSMLAELFESVDKKASTEDLKALTDLFQKVMVDEAARHKQIDASLTELKDKNIVMWMQKNKFVTTMIGALVVIVVLAGEPTVNTLVMVFAKIFGVPVP